MIWRKKEKKKAQYQFNSERVFLVATQPAKTAYSYFQTSSVGLSEEEIGQLQNFVKKGNTVAAYNEHLCGFQKQYTDAEEMYTLEELLEELHICRPVDTNAALLDVKILEGEDKYALFLLNLSSLK